MSVKKIPEGFHTITPYFTVKGSIQFTDFLKNAFDAKVNFSMNDKDGNIAHAQMQIGDSKIELSEARPEFPATAMAIHMYLEDVDGAYNKAIKAGATSVMEPKTQFYGDRECFVKDAFGNSWYIATHMEDVSHEEMDKRMKASEM